MNPDHAPAVIRDTQLNAMQHRIITAVASIHSDAEKTKDDSRPSFMESFPNYFRAFCAFLRSR